MSIYDYNNVEYNGEVWHVKPIWKCDKLVTLVQEDERGEELARVRLLLEDFFIECEPC